MVSRGAQTEGTCHEPRSPVYRPFQAQTLRVGSLGAPRHLAKMGPHPNSQARPASGCLRRPRASRQCAPRSGRFGKTSSRGQILDRRDEQPGAAGKTAGWTKAHPQLRCGTHHRPGQLPPPAKAVRERGSGHTKASMEQPNRRYPRTTLGESTSVTSGRMFCALMAHGRPGSLSAATVGSTSSHHADSTFNPAQDLAFEVADRRGDRDGPSPGTAEPPPLSQDREWSG